MPDKLRGSDHTHSDPAVSGAGMGEGGRETGAVEAHRWGLTQGGFLEAVSRAEVRSPRPG